MYRSQSVPASRKRPRDGIDDAKLVSPLTKQLKLNNGHEEGKHEIPKKVNGNDQFKLDTSIKEDRPKPTRSLAPPA